MRAVRPLAAAPDSAYAYDPAAGLLTLKLVVPEGDTPRTLDIERR